METMTASGTRTMETPKLIKDIFDQIGGGFISDEEYYRREEEAKKEALERTRAARESLYRLSGVPRKFFSALLSEIEDREIPRIATKDNKEIKDFLEVKKLLSSVIGGAQSFLCLCGKSGTGKTALACALLHEACLAGVSCEYVRMNSFMERCESKIEAFNAVNHVCDKDFVVIDDIGLYPNAEWEQYRLYAIVKRLYEDGKSAVLASPLERGEFMRFINGCKSFFVGTGISLNFIGESLRGSPRELYVNS